MDGFRTTVKDGRLLISEPRRSLAVEWGVLALWVLTVGALIEGVRASDDGPLLLVAYSLLTAVPLYLMGLGRHPPFVFDNNTGRLLHGHSTVCERSAIETIEVEELPSESACYKVLVVCKDGKRHEIAEYATHAMALRLAQRIGEHTGIPVIVDRV